MYSDGWIGWSNDPANPIESGTAAKTMAPSGSAGGSVQQRTGTQWAPFMEWTLRDGAVQGNPFDLIATATFKHAASDRQHTTEMFFAGDHNWKFRFTGTRPGVWSFETRSTDPELDGHTGRIMVHPQHRAYGFVTHSGNKWARPQGAEGKLRTFVPQFVMYGHPGTFHEQADRIDADTQTFIDIHGFTGFHVPVNCRWFDIAHDRSDQIRSSDPNPDPRTFAALELLIKKSPRGGRRRS